MQRAMGMREKMWMKMEVKMEMKMKMKMKRLFDRWARSFTRTCCRASCLQAFETRWRGPVSTVQAQSDLALVPGYF